jgi:hypothetical protein
MEPAVAPSDATDHGQSIGHGLGGNGDACNPATAGGNTGNGSGAGGCQQQTPGVPLRVNARNAGQSRQRDRPSAVEGGAVAALVRSNV